MQEKADFLYMRKKKIVQGISEVFSPPLLIKKKSTEYEYKSYFAKVTRKDWLLLVLFLQPVENKNTETTLWYVLD